MGLAGAAVATWLAPGFDEAQANTDRQTVECMTNRLTAEDQAQIAQFADKNDFDSLWRVYDRVFPDCAVRGDQRERKARLEAIAWNPAIGPQIHAPARGECGAGVGFALTCAALFFPAHMPHAPIRPPQPPRL
ncbi:hypothetical protein PQR02_23580 [Paraburkholderia sediminicola]|uniref:Uncharacterized protein n=1 Tax=Paraburkholderia rhynchosiae TaxID=487049 RepID=A0ACC7NHP0_9BURK